MKTSLFAYLLIAGFAAFSSPSQAQQSLPPKGASGMSDVTVITVDIGHFVYGNKIIHIYENSLNKTTYPNNPEHWQFMIEPLLTTLANQDGSIRYESFDLDPICTKMPIPRRRVLIPIQLVSDDAVNLALDRIWQAYPQTKCKIGPQNIDVLPLTRIGLAIPDIDAADSLFHKDAILRSKEQFFLTAPKQFYESFDISETKPSTDEKLRRFINFVPFMQMDAEASFSVKGTLFDLTSISSERLKDTKLYVQLDGLGNGNNGTAYVGRDDLRQLADSAIRQLNVVTIVEDKGNYDNTLFPKLLDQSKEELADNQFFLDGKGKHTYNAEDLAPDVIERTLNKIFTKQSKDDEWKRSGASEQSAGGSYFGIGASESGKNSYSDEELHKLLDENNIENEVQGHMIKVKGLRVRALNISEFIGKTNVAIESRNLENTGLKSNMKTVIFGAPAAPGGPLPDLKKQCEEQPSSGGLSHATPTQLLETR